MNETKQTTQTYTVRLNSEIKTKLENFTNQYKDKGTKGDFIKLLVETFETNNLSSVIENSEADLRELNTMTTRIYNLFSNMSERNSTNIDGLIVGEHKMVQAKNKTNNNLEEKREELEQKNYIESEKTVEIYNLNEKLLEDIQQLKNRASTDDIFIHKLTEEVKEVQTLRAEVKTYREQIMSLQDKHFDDKEKLQNKYSNLLDKSEKEKVEFEKLIEGLRGK